jgi:hypothetical protein
MAKDPILFGGGQANLYVYAGNDPVNRIDPTGLDAERRLECIQSCNSPGPVDKLEKFFCKLGCFGDELCEIKCDLNELNDQKSCRDQCIQQDPYPPPTPPNAGPPCEYNMCLACSP